jgi:transcriptional regulator GlxA family with amidase domain
LHLLTLLLTRHTYESPKLQTINKEKERIDQIKNYMNDNYQQKINLEELANLANLSKYHFIRTFGKATGMAPHMYLKQIRLLRAKNSIVSGDSIISSALNAGFTDQSHFHRNFLKIVATTPREYQINFIQ